jgi:tRNA (guanine26-N2/guanine27-N2)-dimethyltransferase
MTGVNHEVDIDGWPGSIWLEGKTIIHMQNGQPRPSHMPRGPAKKTGPGFLNPAMAPARTRSVLLLADVLENDWLVKNGKSIRVFDALCSTGVRIRRWRNEIPDELQSRLRITANDLDDFALNWARISHQSHPPPVSIDHSVESDRYGKTPDGAFENGIFFQQLDARVALSDASYQWIDVDPFGSPVSFLDSAIQSLARTGVLEVTATDTAALTGSSLSSQQRRYGAKGIVDLYAHDDAVRTLMGLIATTAARHDKSMTPILALFDGHHVRVSVILSTSKENASKVHSNMGWRIRCDDSPYVFKQHPNENQLERASGPMWIGPLWNKEITERMTEQRAMELCHPSKEDLVKARAAGLDWDETDLEYATRELRRSVRHISKAADLMSREHLLLNLDSLPKWSKTPGAPKMEVLIQCLIENGHSAARAPDSEPVFVTDASFQEVVTIVQELNSKSSK